MRVVMLTAEFPPVVGGIAMFAYNMARALKQAGTDVRVITTTPARDWPDTDHLPITRTPGFLDRRYLRLLPLLACAIPACLHRSPDALLAMCWTHDGLLAAILGRLFRIPYTVVVHGSEILRHNRPGWTRSLMLWVLQGAAQIIANSGYTRQLLTRLGIPTTGIAVVNPAITPCRDDEIESREEIDREYGLAGKRVLLTTARLARRKGHAWVIRAIERLRDSHPDLVYVMTGRGAYRTELERLADSLGVRDRVRMIGFVPRRRLWSLYHRADIYVSPAELEDDDVEGFGISLAEAGACGTPVIAATAGGTGDVVVDGETGFLIPPADLNEIHARLTLLLDDEPLRRAMGDRARIRNRFLFSIDRQAKLLGNLISTRRLAGRSSPAIRQVTVP